MIDSLRSYTDKLRSAGLADDAILCAMDDEPTWNRSIERDAAERSVLEDILDELSVSALLCAEPAEPYRTILRHLAERHGDVITPRDCETRTFLHDLPVSFDFTAEALLERLRRRKSVVAATPDGRVRVVTTGTLDPAQAFVTYSSVCFAAFVLFFSEFLAACDAGEVDDGQHRAFEIATAHLRPLPAAAPELLRGPFATEDEARAAIIEAGRLTVEYELVDSSFGNVSYRLGNVVHISQTGSFLDEMAGCIDPCPLDDSSCAGLTASSEFVAHAGIYRSSEDLAVLHGHPKFTVILSMDCAEKDCPNADSCHVACTRERFAGGASDVPIVPGEVGTGPTGLCHTLPPAIRGRRGAIVHGHGLFTVGKVDYNEAFASLLDIERSCREEYFRRVSACRDTAAPGHFKQTGDNPE